MKVIIPFGKPGAGKGTLIKKITEADKNWRVLSTGAALRKAVSDGSEIGMKAKSYMEAGKLVPDEVVVQCVKDALAAIESETECIEGIILDGFPRSIAQVEAMNKLGMIPTKVFDLNVSDEVVAERLSSRVECKNCKTPYSLLKGPRHPKVDGVCDQCGGELIQRADDKPETVRARLAEYDAKTAPVLGKIKELNIPIIETSSDADEEEIKKILS